MSCEAQLAVCQAESVLLRAELAALTSRLAAAEAHRDEALALLVETLPVYDERDALLHERSLFHVEMRELQDELGAFRRQSTN